MAIERRGGGRPVFSSLPDPLLNKEPESLSLSLDSSSPKQSSAKKQHKKLAHTPPPLPPERSPLVSAEPVTADDRQLDQTLDQKIRPHQLSDYIGQQALKDSLAISLQAARQRGEPLDHLLFYGPPGLGKTTLAMALAHAMGATLHTTSAPALERPRDIIGLLMSLQDPEQQAEAETAVHGGDILFIDEIHRLNTISEEILYSAMEDFTLDHTVGKGSSAKTLRIPLPRFTLIGATTKAGALSNPLRDRFGMLYRLNFYTQIELEQIVTRSAKILGLGITYDGAAAIARRSRGTPRIANRLLRRVRDFAIARSGLTLSNASNPHEADQITASIAEDALNLYEIDPLGLDQTDRALLTHLVDTFGGGPVGLDTLASILGEDARTLEDVVEPYLLQVGLVSRTPRGRTATPLTYQHLNKPLPGLRIF